MKYGGESDKEYPSGSCRSHWLILARNEFNIEPFPILVSKRASSIPVSGVCEVMLAPLNRRLPFSSGYQQMEQDRTPPLFAHRPKLARQAVGQS